MRRTFAILALGILVAFSVSLAHAQTGDGNVVWERFDVAMSLLPDGSLQVQETQSIRFRGTYRHGFREIPLDRTTGIDDVTVDELRNGQTIEYDDTGSERPNTYEYGRSGNELRIDWYFQPTQGTETRTFVIRYRARGATRIYEDTAQVFWKAIHAERGGPIENGSVSLAFPRPMNPDEVRSATYLYGSGLPRETTAPRWVDPRTLRTDVANVPDGTGVELRAEFPRSVVPNAQTPAWQAEADRADWVEQSLAPIGTFLALLLSIAIGVGGGVALFVLWYSHGREPDVGATPRTLAEPPSTLPAPLAGTLVDGVADLEDAVAILVDLSQRGVLSMKHTNGDVLVSLHAPTEDPRLRSYERVFLVALFGTGVSSGELMLSSARTRFAASVPVLEDRLYTAIADEGLFVANPEATRRRYTRVGWAGVVVGAVLGFGSLAVLGWAVPIVWLPGAALAIVGLVLVWVARHMPRRTQRGALEAARWQAFRQHLQQDEQDARDADYLAYAVAFGIDRDYLRRLEPVVAPTAGRAYRQPGGVVFLPGGWYGGGGSGGTGGGGFDVPSGPAGGSGASASPGGWSEALSALLSAASEAMAHGGGSGGWSGGGFGGGGGGGGGRGGFN